ncbi:MAG: phosphorylase [Xenococcaceae cyanobacterium MO_207.B15]|nr:phosphorylase [Xenococcaceae cyanobacterium MO_207.B15]
MVEKIGNASEKLLLKPGTLWERLTQQTEYARQTGALQSIVTDFQFIQQDDIAFLVRSVSNLARKQKAQKQQKQKEIKTGKYFDPFLPYEEDLFVSDISPTHLCLLNKFNVVEHHLLIVTRAFEEQDELLNIKDFVALWACMQEIDGLAFYNGGKIAGASQRHKHLQLVPLPFIPNTDIVPIQPAIDQVVFTNSVGTIPSFPFLHAIARIKIPKLDSPLAAAKVMLDCYYSLLETVGISIDPDNSLQLGAYNLLATRNWMLLVPRKQEAFASISINSLGFAGSLFVRDRTSLELLQELSPMAILNGVSVTKEVRTEE